MQIIIPMSGFGERFRRCGYQVPKPLLEIDGKPIVAHVIAMFPGEQDFIFICNQEHLDHPAYHMAALLKQYCPLGQIVGIPPHQLGPVHAIQQVEHLLDPARPVVVNYCDFNCYWDWQHFKSFLRHTKCQGAIPAYQGFHPHSLSNTNYAYMRELNGWVQDIQEKQPYTSNRMAEYASSGTYYFATAQLMNTALRMVKAQDLNVHGEYYVSLAYKPLLAAGHAVAIYPLQHFIQWGTPEDVAEYKLWSEAFKGLLVPRPPNPQPKGALIIPMAGLGQRFAKAGYPHAKPLLSVAGRPMVVQAVHDLPDAAQQVFVVRADMQGYESAIMELQRCYPRALIHTVAHVTEGQACTALMGLEALEKQYGNITGPITIGACDNGVVYDANAYQRLLANQAVDVIVWGVRGFPNALRHPHMFSWIAVEAQQILAVSVKAPLTNPAHDPMVLGTVTFRHATDLRRVVRHLIARDGRNNGEFYLDACINDAIALGLRCQLFEVTSYLCWGTPHDLSTFEYWQSYFHKWVGHPYSLALDQRVPAAQLSALEAKYQAIVPQLPGSQLC